MIQTATLLARLIPSAAEPQGGFWNSCIMMLPWLLLVIAVCVAAVVLLKHRRKLLECQAHDEIRVLIESAGQAEQLWSEKCEDLEKKLVKDLARQEKHLRRYYRQKQDRYKEEIRQLREQNLELKESVSQLMQNLKNKH
jgi:biopolymer transport protein ExbB/TolQ